MARLLTIFLAILILLLVAGGIFLYLAYGIDGQPPGEQEVRGLTQPVVIHWTDEEGVARIRAEDRSDELTGLGYVHGSRRGWMAVLLRQTALSRLGEWYGTPVMELDSLTRQLGLAQLAQESFRNLPEQTREELAAYAEGMNAALTSPSVQRQSAFVLLRDRPDRWEPWHSLAVERLLVWLSADESATIGDEPPGDAVEAFLERNTRLRQWLRLHGFRHSTAWAVQDTLGTQLYQRHVYGASALPLYQEVTLQRPGQDFIGITLPGLPYLIAGRTGSRSWAFLPSTTAQFEPLPYDTTQLNTHFERLRDREGNEFLLRVPRSEHALPLETPAEQPTFILDTLATLEDTTEVEPSALPADTVWHLTWTGFAPGTDYHAWRDLAQGNSPVFELFRGDGLMMDSTGNWEVLGAPDNIESIDGGIILGNSRWTPYLARQLQDLTDPSDRNPIPALVDSDSSAWAAELAPDMLASLDSLEARLDQNASYWDENDPLSEAVTYLRNWDFVYERASIGASVFDAWVRSYRDATGALPVPATETDTIVFFEDLRRARALQTAIQQLTETFGEDLRQWRWENVSPDVRYFPRWNNEDINLPGGNALSRTRYAPISFPGRGHPSSLSWGTALIEPGLPSPAAWEAWISTADWEGFTVRRRQIDTSSLLGRYRTPERRPAPLSLRLEDEAQVQTTRLLPAGN